MIRVLVVDDNALTRLFFSRMLSKDPGITVVGTARDGREALEMSESLKPDVVTMDVLMPQMDGITALRHIMTKRPLPVIMVSAVTTEGAKATLQALEVGAVDFVTKDTAGPAASAENVIGLLAEKIKAVAGRRVAWKGPFSEKDLRAQTAGRMQHYIASPKKAFGIVAIGASTGGPKALQEIIPCLSRDLPVPVVIAQHMPPAFTGPFAERLNEQSLITVKEAREGEPLRPGVALVAPGGGHMRVTRKGKEAAVTISGAREGYAYRPSVDALMSSVAQCYPGRALGIILTGMGNDGLKGLSEVKKTGGIIFAQDEESCVVYGMPKAVVDAGIADRVLPPDKIAEEIARSL